MPLPPIQNNMNNGFKGGFKGGMPGNRRRRAAVKPERIKDMNKELNNDLNKDMNKELNKDLNKDLNKENIYIYRKSLRDSLLGDICLGEKVFVPLEKAMVTLAYNMRGIENCIRQGMPKIIYRGSYYFCLEDCYKWHLGKW